MLARPEEAHRRDPGLLLSGAAVEVHHLDQLLATVASTGPPSELFLVVQPMHGLGNRIRALVSAMAAAEALSRRFAVVWNRDVHCDADFSDLFEPPIDAAGRRVLVFNSPRLGQLKRRKDVDVLLKGEPLNASAVAHGMTTFSWRSGNLRRHVYIQSSSLLDLRTTSLNMPRSFSSEMRRAAEKAAQSLAPTLHRLQPKQPVVTAALAMAGRVGLRVSPSFTVASTSDRPVLGVHVRMQGNLSIDVPNIGGSDSVGNQAINSAAMRPEIVSQERSKCHWRNFVEPALAALAKLTPPLNARVYVASDTADAPQHFCDALKQVQSGVVCTWAPEELDVSRRCTAEASPERRGVYCQQMALAELLVLAQSTTLLTSGWSSYSEVAVLWGRNMSTVLGCMHSSSNMNTRHAWRRGVHYS